MNIKERYEVKDRTIIDTRHNEQVATCATHSDAVKACALWKRARRANDLKREYTKAARLIADMEAIPGFQWAHK